MRKFLVKHFVLAYYITLFGKKYAAPRASRIIFPLMVITGWFHTTNDGYPNPTLFIWLLFGLLVTSLYLGFIHFAYLFPVKWDELDESQKLQYGQLKSEKLTKAQFLEWCDIRIKLTGE